MMLTRRAFSGLVAFGAAALSARASATAASPRTATFALPTALVPGPVNVAVYLPPSYRDDPSAALPLVLMLHGGNGSERDMLRFTARIDQEITAGRLAPMVIATPSAGRSLYMDFRDGSQRWESFLLGELLPHLRQAYRVASDRAGTYVAGWSMGGLGALRVAFKHPDLFRAVAAVEPAIEPALIWSDVGPNVRFWRSEETLRSIFGNPIDQGYWADNNPASIAASEHDRLLDLAMYFEVGDQDMLYLYEGAEFLHRTLFDARIAHEYRLVHGAEHVGPSLEPRLIDALGFLSRQISPPVWIDDAVRQARAVVDAQRRGVGLPASKVDPRRLK